MAEPKAIIVEQPASKHRFRYASELSPARTLGSIHGAHSSPERRTFPTIAVPGHYGPMVVMLTLVNPTDYLVHPHRLTGTDQRYHCHHGVISLFADGPQVSFNNVGILCVKRKSKQDITDALNDRRGARIDPFGAGFEHMSAHRRINFDAVRLCFSVYLPGPDFKPEQRENVRTYSHRLPLLLSDVVHNSATPSELKIVHLSGFAGSVMGGTEMTLLCDKYSGANPDVVFEGDGWEARADVKLYHRQFAIVFTTPRYHDVHCTRPVEVDVYLQRPGARGPDRSRPAAAELLPLRSPPPAPPGPPGAPGPPPSQPRSKPAPPGYLPSKIKKPTLAQQCAAARAARVPDAPELTGVTGSKLCTAQPRGEPWHQPSTSNVYPEPLNPYFRTNATPNPNHTAYDATCEMLNTHNVPRHQPPVASNMTHVSYALPNVNTTNCMNDPNVYSSYPLKPISYDDLNEASPYEMTPSRSNYDAMSPEYPHKEEVTANTDAPLPNVIPTVQSHNPPPDVLSLSPDASNNGNFDNDPFNVNEITHDELLLFVHGLVRGAQVDEEMLSLSEELKKLCSIPK